MYRVKSKTFLNPPGRYTGNNFLFKDGLKPNTHTPTLARSVLEAVLESADPSADSSTDPCGYDSTFRHLGDQHWAIRIAGQLSNGQSILSDMAI